MIRNNHEFLNAQAVEAAEWMRDEMGRNKGILTQDEAWQGIRERFGETCAVTGATGCWLNKQILSAFRKLTPDVIWDPAGRQWRHHRSNDAMKGVRMIDAKVAS